MYEVKDASAHAADYVFLANKRELPSEADDSDSLMFFDEANMQVIVTHPSGGELVVTIHDLLTPANRLACNLKGDIHLITMVRLSPDSKWLAIQRSASALEFMSLGGGAGASFSQPTSRRGSYRILGFFWVDSTDVAYVTDKTVELYRLGATSAKRIKYYYAAVDWFTFSHEAKLLVVYSNKENAVHTYQFLPGSSNGATRFARLDSLCAPLPGSKSRLEEKDVCVGVLYGRTCLLRIRGNVVQGNYSGAEVEVYELTKSSANLLCTLFSARRGNFAISIADNMIVLHHQESKTCQVYDIHQHMPGGAASSSLAIRPLAAPSSLVVAPPDNGEEPYGDGWIFFSLNVVVDSTSGSLWEICIDLPTLAASITEPAVRIPWLTRRAFAKETLLRQIHHMCLTGAENMDPGDLDRAFDTIVPFVARHSPPLAGDPVPNVENSHSLLTSIMGASLPAALIWTGVGSSAQQGHGTAVELSLTQGDIYDHVLTPIQGVVAKDWLLSVTLGLVDSLSRAGVPVHPRICTYLVGIVLSTRQYGTLNTLLTTNVLTYAQIRHKVNPSLFRDSVECVRELLEARPDYDPAGQLALDMLKRLGTQHELQVQVLLEAGQVMPALRYVDEHRLGLHVSARLMLKAAAQTGCKVTLYSVLQYFEDLEEIRRYAARGKQGVEESASTSQMRHERSLAAAAHNTEPSTDGNMAATAGDEVTDETMVVSSQHDADEYSNPVQESDKSEVNDILPGRAELKQQARYISASYDNVAPITALNTSVSSVVRRDSVGSSKLGQHIMGVSLLDGCEEFLEMCSSLYSVT